MKIISAQIFQLTNQNRLLNAYAQPLVNSFTIKGVTWLDNENKKQISRGNKNCIDNLLYKMEFRMVLDF